MAARRKESATVDIKIRMKEPVRAEIERSAKRRGVSMNGEMVDRLERSFDAEQGMMAVLSSAWGPRTTGIALLVGRLLSGADTAAKIHQLPGYLEDREVFDLAKKWIVDLLQMIQPPQVTGANPLAKKSLAHNSALTVLALADHGGDDPLRGLLGDEILTRMAGKQAVKATKGSGGAE